jgi:hypothetical protein
MVVRKDEFKLVQVGERVCNTAYVGIKSLDIILFVKDWDDERDEWLSGLHLNFQSELETGF